ncbi:ParA family protein [Thiothrix lacustris]|uniref:ParA family protein n=1 Tax=Thiothrix lacustris TaxID=525917 RepID=UPI003FEE0E20
MPMYIAVFTAKGGVGKTVTAAHVAGALRLLGRSVVLIDADPQRNLFGAVGQYLTVHAGKKANPVVQVFTDDDADAQIAKMYSPPNFIVVDCSPSPTTGDATERYLKMATCCICPITLSPLGVGKYGQRITDTLRFIRQGSKSAKAFVLVNRYPARLTQAATSALDVARTTVQIARTKVKDKNLYFLDPEHDLIKIRDSGILERFGDGTPVFPAGQAGAHPREDFMQLVAYLKDKGFLMQTEKGALEVA